MTYNKMAEEILENIGGVENINNVTHCATRLRINFKNASLVNDEGIKNADKVVGYIRKPDQIQIVIGPKVTDAYNEFIEVSKWTSQGTEVNQEVEQVQAKRNFMYYVNKVGNFCASSFMPMIPALIIGGLILAIRNLLINYFGFDAEGGTTEIMLSIFRAAFTFLPIYLGFNVAKTLKMQPIMGALLGTLLVSPSISNVEGLSFLGISIPTVDYSSSVMPIVFGCFFMYFVDKGLAKIIPEAIIYFMKPLLTMIIVVPVTLIVLGPIGTQLSTGFANIILWLMENAGFVAMPILAAVYPYMVMLGLDKALTPVGIQLIAQLGYNPLTITAGFVSNLAIGATTLALAMSIKNNKEKKGMITSFAITGLCGVTEPAFYGALIQRPLILIGTAIGAVSGGLVAGIFGLVNYVHGGCPGLLTFLFFLNPDGSMYNFILSFIVAAVTISVTFVATKVVIAKTKMADEEEVLDETTMEAEEVVEESPVEPA
ncbi:PTS transporter subunit EIIC [Enterococcus sp. HY326]|uniref:PTS transporter subunit EIIC n=1 Tax=Enterococcus sp. HY326 TaxID=2971265 RepID=UPI00223FFBBB|nr:PTS transporter subunit EIIC [Enterococcus sp. HY326]